MEEIWFTFKVKWFDLKIVKIFSQGTIFVLDNDCSTLCV